MYIVYRLVAYGSVCRSVLISSAFGVFIDFGFSQRQGLVSTKCRQQPLLILRMYHPGDPGVFHSRCRLSFMGTHEHFSVEYSGCQIFHIEARFISGSH